MICSKRVAVELAGGAAEARIAGDAVGDFGVVTPSRSCLRLLVERRLGDQLAEQLPVEAERVAWSGVIGRPTWRLDLLQRSL